MSDESPALSAYRIYRLGEDGHIMGVEIIEASQDLDAISLAVAKIEGSPIELWDRGRFLGRFAPRPDRQ